MNDQTTLDHPTCYNPTGRWEASGEWEASPDVLIHLRSYGVAKGPDIVWEHQVEQIDLYEGEQQTASVYTSGENHNLVWTNTTGSYNWLTGVPLSATSKFWLLGVAYCWAVKNADKWANVRAQAIP